MRIGPPFHGSEAAKWPSSPSSSPSRCRLRARSRPIPLGEETVLVPLTSWRRWGGHVARLAAREPERWISEAIHWRDATYRESMRATFWREPDPDRLSLGCGIHVYTTLRRDDPLQAHCNAKGFQYAPWQTTAQSKDEWQAFEHTVVQARLGVRPHVQVPNGRGMGGETPYTCIGVAAFYYSSHAELLFGCPHETHTHHAHRHGQGGPKQKQSAAPAQLGVALAVARGCRARRSPPRVTPFYSVSVP